MGQYQSFIDDPAHLRLLEGQRYVVLRPDAAVSAIHANARKLLEKEFAHLSISYPRRGHVTLAGFPQGTSLEAIQDLVREWSTEVPHLTLDVEGHDSFPPPAKIAVVRILKTEDLIEALARLRASAVASNLNPLAFITVEEWIFHMSVAYCSSLTDEDWAKVVSKHEGVEVASHKCVASDVEIAAFDNGAERPGGSFVLRG